MSDVNWLFLDLNSYFASVEQQLRPELRGKPIGIVPTKVETTCCIAASYEAKAYGVKTGTIVAEARKMCPGIQFVEARHREYVDYHHQIAQAIDKCVPVYSVSSIDEFACKLMGRERQLKKAKKIAEDVKKTIYETVGTELRCSIGLGPNKYLSKVAADMQKPNGLTTLLSTDLPKKLFQLKLRDFPGVGMRMENRLNVYGIQTTEQMYALDLRRMRDVWGGVWGERMYHWIRGADFDVEFGENKSIGHSHVMAPKYRNEAGAHAVLVKQLHKVGFRLRKINHYARRMYVSVRCLNGPKWRDEIRMSACQDFYSLSEVFKVMWNRRKIEGIPFKVSIALYDLISHEDKTLSFFDQPRYEKLSHVMDKINLRYGRSLLFPAAMRPAIEASPTRIAFTQIPEFSVEDDEEL